MSLEHKFELQEGEGKLERMISDVIAKVFEQKEQQLVNALKSHEIDIDPKEEALRRFPRLLCEVHDQEQRHYWNDGSEHGLHIITFVDNTPSESEGKFYFSFTVKEYVQPE